MKPQNKYFKDVLNVSPRGDAQIHKIPTSKNWYFKMWIPEENRQVRLSLKTQDQATAFELGNREYAKILGSLSAGKKLFGKKFQEVCEEWLVEQSARSRSRAAGTLSRGSMTE